MHATVEFRCLASLLVSSDETKTDVDRILSHLRAFYEEIPGLALSVKEVQEVFGLDSKTCDAVLRALIHAGFLREDGDSLLSARRGGS